MHLHHQVVSANPILFGVQQVTDGHSMPVSWCRCRAHSTASSEISKAVTCHPLSQRKAASSPNPEPTTKALPLALFSFDHSTKNGCGSFQSHGIAPCLCLSAGTGLRTMTGVCLRFLLYLPSQAFFLGLRPFYLTYMWEETALPKSEHERRVASSISLSKSYVTVFEEIAPLHSLDDQICCLCPSYVPEHHLS